jgi:DNA-binding MarR family transcriptional regulator
MITAGANLALLLLGGFRYLAGAASDELRRQGFPGITAANEFAMRAIANGADSASSLANSLSVSKQAAAKTISALENYGYVTKAADPGDARRNRIVITDLGHRAMAEGEKIMVRLRDGWVEKIGEAEVKRLEDNLVELLGPSPVDLADPGQPEVV